jgi:hypothetical protein
VTSRTYAPGLIALLCVICPASVASGQTSWLRTYGGTGSDGGTEVQQTADGGYIVAGSTSSFGAGSDAYLIKTNAQGDTLWTRTYGGTSYDQGWSVQQTADGGYVIAGYTESFGAGNGDVYLIKTNASGDTLWTRTYGGTEHDEGCSVQLTADGGYIIAGRTYSPDAEDDVYLIKTNASGDTLWTRTYGGTSHDLSYSVQRTADSGYIIAGLANCRGEEDGDVYLIKTNASGDTLWTRTHGGTNHDWGFSVQQTADGGYIIAGSTYSFGAGNSDIYLVKTDASGDTLWTRVYGGKPHDYGFSVLQTAAGAYIVAGTTGSFGAYWDAFLIKTDSLGNVAE